MDDAAREAPPSPQLLKQRIRENIIDYLEIASSADVQRDFQRRAPMVVVANELINMWEDSVIVSDLGRYGQPVFSPAESEAIRAFHAVWTRVADETPERMPDAIESWIGTETWTRLMDAARLALAVFQIRGRFSRDTEAPTSALGPSN